MDFQIQSQRRSGITSQGPLIKDLSYYFHTEESLPHPTLHMLTPVSLLSLCKVIQLPVSTSHFLYLTQTQPPRSLPTATALVQASFLCHLGHGHSALTGVPLVLPWLVKPPRCYLGYLKQARTCHTLLKILHCPTLRHHIFKIKSKLLSMAILSAIVYCLPFTMYQCQVSNTYRLFQFSQQPWEVDLYLPFL